MASQKALKILFATDFSPSARMTIQTLKLLQKAYNTDISLTHIITSSWKEWLSNHRYQKEALQRLQLWQQEIDQQQDATKLHVLHGNAAEHIIELANTTAVNLILMGGKGSGKGSRYRTGTVVESVARHAPQSVWVCKSKSISNVLCGIDASPHSAKTLNKAIELCQHFSAKLRIISVISAVDFNPLGMEDEEIEKHEERFREENIAMIKKFLSDFDFKGIDVEYYYPWGTPAHIILDTAEDLNHDLIIIGAQGHSQLHHLFIGSTAEKILRHTPCSLLIVK